MFLLEDNAAFKRPARHARVEAIGTLLVVFLFFIASILSRLV
jgi:hypothetical protein